MLRPSEPADGAKPASIVFCGDWAPEGLNGGEPRYGGLAPILRESDLAVVNVEAVLTDGDIPGACKDGIHLRLPPAALSGLAEVPFHVACLANNHIMDFGLAGLERTLRHLYSKGMRVVGAGVQAERAEQPLACSVGDTLVGIINAAEGEESRSVDGGPGAASLDIPRISGQIHEVKRQGALAMVVVHAGREYLPVPAPHIRHAFRALAAAGADLIVGHHPHVPQGMALVDGTPIAYSLGNFDLPAPPDAWLQHLGYALKASISRGRVLKVQAIPYRIGTRGPVLLEGEERRQFGTLLAELSRLAADQAAADDLWAAYVDRWLEATGLGELGGSLALLGGSRLLVRSALLHTLGLDQRRTGRRPIGGRLGWKLVAAIQPSGVKDGGPARQAAAVVRNRFDTISHQQAFLAALQRVMDGRAGTAPAWAHQLLDEWHVFELDGRQTSTGSPRHGRLRTRTTTP